MEPTSTIPAAPLATSNPKTSTDNNNTPAPNGPNSPIPSQSNPNRSSSTQKSRGPIIGLIICALLAVFGLAFGVYGVISSNHKSSEIDGLKSIITQKDQTIANLKQPETPTTPAETPTETTTAPQTNSYTLFADNLANFQTLKHNHQPST